MRMQVFTCQCMIPDRKYNKGDYNKYKPENRKIKELA